jgi:transcriptional regulator with XRE-family HTH domain
MKDKLGCKKFGKTVRQKRLAVGMTLEQFAERSGLSPNYIGSVELGKRDPSLSTVRNLADGLGVAAGELVGPVVELSAQAVEAARLFDLVDGEIQEGLVSLLRAVQKKGKR